jgi:hypothetical protein
MKTFLSTTIDKDAALPDGIIEVIIYKVVI